MNKNPVNQISKLLVDALFFLGIIAVIAVPLLAKYVSSFYGYDGTQVTCLAVILFAAGLCALYVLFNLRLMFRTLLGGNPFVDKNIVCFRRMAAACAAIAVLCVVKCFMLFTFGTVAVVIVFVVGAMFCLTLKNIFEQAIAYKQENDMTI